MYHLLILKQFKQTKVLLPLVSMTLDTFGYHVWVLPLLLPKTLNFQSFTCVCT